MKKYNVIVATDVGTFIVNRNDTGVGWQLAEYGAYDRAELSLIAQIMSSMRRRRENLIAMDIGANIGMHSIMLSSQVGPFGKVYAFEAQRIIFNMLAGNVAINSINNVYCFNLAVSDKGGSIEIPQFDYGKPLSFGSVEFGPSQKEYIGQTRRFDASSQEQVASIALDHCGIEHVDFLKIDVEGMELQVLSGAETLIRKSNPMMLVEYLKSDAATLAKWLTDLSYTLYSGVGENYLCVPTGSDIRPNGLKEVRTGN